LPQRDEPIKELGMKPIMALIRTAEAGESAEAPSPSEGFRWHMKSTAMRIALSLASLSALLLALEAGRRW
jgi:hypothetical protein